MAMTPQQRKAALAGLESAKKAGPEEMARRGSKGGNSTLENHGVSHFRRAAHIRWQKHFAATQTRETRPGKGRAAQSIREERN